MSFVLVPAGQAPPSDKPWLLSSRDDLAADEKEQRQYISVLKEECPFPGVSAGMDAKLKWMKSIQEAVEGIMEETLWSSNCPDADVAAAEIMQEHAPENLWLGAYVSKDNLDQVDEVDEEAFRAGLSKYGRVEYKGEATWEAYSAWLKAQDETDTEESAACLGYVKCSKADKTMDQLTELMNGLGLSKSLRGVTLLDQRKFISQGCWRWGINRKLSSNVCLPTGRGMVVKVKLDFKKVTETEKANKAFKKLLGDIERRYEDAGVPKTFLMVPKPLKKGKKHEDDSDDDEDADDEESIETAETMDVLWLPKIFEEERSRIQGHFRGEGECKELQARLMKGNTDTGNLTMEIFNSNFQHIKDYGDLPSKFCGALALTMAASDSPYWMEDNEFPEEVEEHIRLLSNYWRTNLLKKTDAELGLGLDDDKAIPGAGMSESRRALYTLLGMLAPAFDDVPSYSGKKVALKWKPGKPRKRKESPKSVADVSKKQCS